MSCLASSWRARVAAAVLVAGLAGCAHDRIRDDAQQMLRDGRFEEAVAALDAGVKAYPDSPALRSNLLQARNEALARLLGEAAVERAAGRIDEAEALLRRAQPFDSSGKRVAALLADAAVERRQRSALNEAQSLATAGRTREAQRLLADALKDNPRQPELLALQRRLDADAFRQQARAVQQGLAETRPIALDFRDANLRTVLDVVTRNSGINFILDKDIRQDVRVTVLLRSARVEDAIDLIVSTHQLAKKVIDPQTVLIYPNTPEKQREHQEQVVKVFYLANADAKGAAAFLRSMLRLRDPFIDERSNMLALREPAETIELAERLIALYDTNEPEVLLELEVMEVRTSRLTDLGIKFPDAVGLTPLAPSGATGLTLDNLRGLGSDRVGVSVAGLLLNLKREVGDFTTLANPRIRARSKEKAKVLIGDKVPIITATTGQGGFVADSVSYIDVGLKLDVEPTVYADDEVAIRISLEVSSQTREVRTSSGSLAYQIGTRTASTLLRLRDGETQLLAGLISKEERSSASRVPGLGDLPIAGRLFSQQRDEALRTELVLAVTPRVIRNLRRPDAAETEIWVGTEAAPRLRPVGGLAGLRAAAAAGPASSAGTAGAGAPGAAPAAAVAPGSPVAAGAGGAPSAGPADPSAAFPAAAALAGPATLDLRWQAPGEVKAGDVFVATLQMKSSVPLRGLPMQFRYPAARLQLLDIEEGDYFKAGGAATSYTQAIDAAAGTARAGVLRNQASGTPGQGTLVQLRMKALSAGPAEVQLTAVEPVSLGQTPPPVAMPQSFRVQVK